jgi:hypothetical protein
MQESHRELPENTTINNVSTVGSLGLISEKTPISRQVRIHQDSVVTEHLSQLEGRNHGH